MKNKDKKRDPMPPPDATPEEIGEFWDTHSLTDYWDETHEVDFQVNLESRQNLSPDEGETTELHWQKLKDLIQSIKPKEFEKLVAKLLTSFLEDNFVVARSGDQPRGDARSVSGDITIQAKRYSDKTLRAVEVVGDIHRAKRSSQNLQVYVLAISRDINEQLLSELEGIEEDTGLDIVELEFTDKLPDLGVLCVTFWENIREFFDLSGINQQFLDWVGIEKGKSETTEKISELRDKLKDKIQTYKRAQEDVEKHLRERFSTEQGFNPIDLSQAVGRDSLESKIIDWWETETAPVPVCCLEGQEGHGKSWLAAKAMNTLREEKNILAFWLDSKDWNNCESIFDLLRNCFNLVYPSYKQEKINRFQNKAANSWPEMLIVLDGVNERNAIVAAQQILEEYFRHDEWSDRIRFLLTTRPLDKYPDFESYPWNRCHKISIAPFNESELQEALNQKGLQLNDLPDSLKEIASIPRYFPTCIELRESFRSFESVTKEMVLWADLLKKIQHTSDPQVRKKLDLQSPEDAQEILAKLAKEAKWTNIDNAPEISVEILQNCFSSDYHEIRRDLEEQRIAPEARKTQTELSEDHIVLGWALYISNLFDHGEFSGVESLLECFQQELKPIPSEDLRTKALFVALHISAIFPDPNIPQDQLSQKRAALMLAWFNSHNAEVTSEQLLFWAEKDTDAYAQVVESEFGYHNSPNHEEMLIKPLAKIWLQEKGQLNCLASRLTEWLLPTFTNDTPEEFVYIHTTGQPLPREQAEIQLHLLNAALSILSQRPDRQFLRPLARCYGIVCSNEESYRNLINKSHFYENIGRLMRWGYTEEVLENLYQLAELAQTDALLLRGVCGLVEGIRVVDLPPLLKQSLSEEELERRAFIEKRKRLFKPPIDRIRNREQLLTGGSPADNVKGNYHGLDYLAVRTDLPDLHDDDLDEIKKVLHYISMNAELGLSVGASLEDFCIENLMPWVAKDDPESYAELACSLKLNTLNQKWAQLKLGTIHGVVFKPEDCERITEGILGMKQRLFQDIQTDNSSSDVIHLIDLLTETLLFSASEEELTDWFEFLAAHELLRISIFTQTPRVLLNKLLPASIVRLPQQKLKISESPLLDNQFPSNTESEEITEADFWWWLYLCISDDDENTVIWALENLKQKKPDDHPITFYSLRKATSDSNRFLSEILTDEKVRRHLFLRDGTEILTDEKVRRHLFLRDGRLFENLIYKGESSDSYEDLVSVLPQEIVGSFFCSPERRADLSRWGKELMEKMCLMLQGDEGDFHSAKERSMWINPSVLEVWSEQNKTDFLRLTNEYLTELFKSPRYRQALRYFTDAILCLFFRFRPTDAMQYYRQLNAEGFRTIYSTHYGVETFYARLWQVKNCNLPEHRDLRRKLLAECVNDEEIMFMTFAALTEGGEEELWSLVTKEYLASPYAKEKNLGVSILPWFGNDKAVEKLARLKSDDSNRWVREHAAWAYEVAQQERSCREVYREALQTRNLFRISAVFEQIEPALFPIAQWWSREIEKEEFGEELQNAAPKLFALLCRFWDRWENSSRMKHNFKVFGRKLREHCRGERLPAVERPRIAPWWKPDSN